MDDGMNATHDRMVFFIMIWSSSFRKNLDAECDSRMVGELGSLTNKHGAFVFEVQKMGGKWSDWS